MVLLKQIDKLTLWDMIRNPEMYIGIADGLVALPLPDKFHLKRKKMNIPATLEEFSGSICYGQRLYLSREEPNDFGIIIRLITGYYYPIYTGNQWDDETLYEFINIIPHCKAKDIYPVSTHLTNLFGELIEREHKYLYREPTAIERAAGIEKLNIYSELNALDFLRDSMKITTDEVLRTPYNDCLVRFMNAKAVMEFQERHYKLMQEKNELTKSKFKKK